MRFSAFIKSVTLSLLLLFVFLLVKTPAFAQSAISQNIPQVAIHTQPNLLPDTNPDVPNNLHTFSQSLLLEILSSFSCNLSGKDPLSKNGQCIGFDPSTGKIGYVKDNNGLVGSMTGMITMLYTPPLHTSDFIAYMGQNFGIAKPSFAQTNGIGFVGLTPLLHAWVVFRNIVYLLFVFIFLLIGLAIMMRIKIDPRTVMTIQNQNPKIIISLILVTFSFAIAGFLIDMMWVGTYVVINVMHEADPHIIVSDVKNNIYSPAPQFANDALNDKEAAFSLGGIHGIAFNGAGGIADIVKKFIAPDTLPKIIPPQATSNSGGGGNGCGFPNVFGCVSDLVGGLGNTIRDPGKTAGDVAGAAAGVVLGPIGDIVGGIFSNVISWVVGIVAYLILICALLIALLKLWLALLKAYISILIDVLFAPFWIMGGLIPGQTAAGFGPWLRDMAGNLAAFPATILMLLLAKLFSDGFIAGAVTGASTGIFTGNVSSTAFVPPLIASNAFGSLSSLIALGVILATPGVVDMTKKAFKAPELKMGTIGKSFGAGAAFVGNPAKRFGKSMFGKDENGNAKAGSAFIGRHGGAVAQWATGGGTDGARAPGKFISKIPGLRKVAGSSAAKAAKAEENAKKSAADQAAAIGAAVATHIAPPTGTGSSGGTGTSGSTGGSTPPTVAT